MENKTVIKNILGPMKYVSTGYRAPRLLDRGTQFESLRVTKMFLKRKIDSPYREPLWFRCQLKSSRLSPIWLSKVDVK